MIEETLRNVGLSPEETEVYLSLLSFGTMSPTEVATKTKVKRTYVYKICEDLLKKGLVTITQKGAKKAYAPASPDYLLSIAEKKRQEIENNAEQLEKVLSELKTKYSTVETRPLVKTYEGLEGLKKLYLDTLSEGKDIDALVDTSDIDLELRDWLKTVYLPKRVGKKIHANVILASGKLSNEYSTRNETGMRTVKVVDSNKYPIKNEVNVYGNKVAFIQNHKGEPLIGVIIENKIISQTLKAWFDLAWKNSK